MNAKRCNSCRQDKDPSAFSKDASRKDGLRLACRSCRSVQQKEWRKRNPRTVTLKVQPEATLTAAAKPSAEFIAKVTALRDEISYTFDQIKDATCEDHRQAFTEYGRQTLMKDTAELLAMLNLNISPEKLS